MRRRWPWLLVIIVVVGAGALVWDREFGSEWHRVLWVRLDGTEAIEYGYVRWWDVHWGVALFIFPVDNLSTKDYWPIARAVSNRRYELHWHRSDGTRRYYVHGADADRGSVDLRCSRDVERLWVYGRRWRGILCSLDRASGQYLNRDELPGDWRLSPQAQRDYWINQETFDTTRRHPPEAVADPQGGRLLATGDPCWD